MCSDIIHEFDIMYIYVFLFIFAKYFCHQYYDENFKILFVINYLILS